MRRRRQRYTDTRVVQRHRFGVGSVMVCCRITENGKTGMVFADGVGNGKFDMVIADGIGNRKAGMVKHVH